MLLGDQPISNSLQDKLDRADFCKYLAKAVLSYESKECIVIGLLGSWGSGKSSMLNMVIEFLHNIFEKGDYIPSLEFDMDIGRIVDFIDIPVSELELRIKNIINSEQYEKLDKKEKIALKTFTRKIS